MKTIFAFLVLVLLVAGCHLPQWRVFERKVDQKLAEKSPKQIEAERQGAQYIVEASAGLLGTITLQLSNVQTGGQWSSAAQNGLLDQVRGIHAVALELSSSLGQPAKAVTVADQALVQATLRNGLRIEQAKAEAWKQFAIKNANRPIEGTGINLAGPAGLIGLVVVIAACVACPPIGYALLRVLPLLWGFFKRTTSAIGEFAKANPDAGDELASKLSEKMDKSHKRLVRVRAKKSLIVPAIEPTNGLQAA